MIRLPFIRTLLTATMIGLFVEPAAAKFTVCNHFDKAISVSFASVMRYQNPFHRIAHFFGWYGVGAGECRAIKSLGGDNSGGEVTNGQVTVQNGILRNVNEAMYLYVRDDLGKTWNAQTTSILPKTGAQFGHRTDDGGYVWPDSLNICTPSPREPVQYPGGFDIIHLDFIEEPPKCSPGTARAPYFMINPMYYVEFQIDVR